MFEVAVLTDDMLRFLGIEPAKRNTPPKPELPPTLDEYKQYDPHHLSRLAIKPGLTGMWQTSGRSEITDFEEIVRLDNEYIRSFSLALDIKLIFKTFVTVLGMKGSK